MIARSHWQVEVADANSNNIVAVIIGDIPSDIQIEAGELTELVDRGMKECPEVFSVARSFLLQVNFSLLLYYPFIVWGKIRGMEFQVHQDPTWCGWVARL